ncbi:MAG: DUF1207 domain-containing protein [Chlamydiales bacterium]|nr:DUF1207 domain-containing protein [Chlamydiales bacterium]
MKLFKATICIWMGVCGFIGSGLHAQSQQTDIVKKNEITDSFDEESVATDELAQSRPRKEFKKSLARNTISDMRKDSVPDDIKQNATYLEGYLQALLDMHYYEFKVTIKLKGRQVFLYNLPDNRLVADSIVQFVADFPEVDSVQIAAEPSSKDKNDKKDTVQPVVKGIWMPQSTILFPPITADPKAMKYGVGLRFHDDIIARRAVAVTFGDELPFFRWHHLGDLNGDAQFSIAAGVRAIFDATPDEGFYQRKGDWAELVNSDFLLSFPFTYAIKNWAFRVRVYHISSHLGDEFYQAKIRQQPTFKRKNPSSETLDFFTSYQLTNAIRVYAGLGYTFHKDNTFPYGHGGLEYGCEVRLAGRRDYYNQLYHQPFMAMHFHHLQDVNWKLNATYQIGIEWSKLHGIGRKIRAYVEYHNGKSLEGEFALEKTNYLSINLSYGF